jgi:hypothetical protein
LIVHSSRLILAGMARIKRLPDGFIIPAQPVMASKAPSGADLGSRNQA